MFNFIKKAFKEANNETKVDDLKQTTNKRKKEENFAFDEEIFKEFEFDSDDDKNE